MNLTKKKILYPGATIGIIGAGQLGKMLAQSAQAMGYQVATYDPNPKACAFPVSDWHQVGSFDDREALLTFANQVDVLTYEFENVNGELLKALDRDHYLPQGVQLLLTSQDRLSEKDWLNAIGLKTAPYQSVETMEDLLSALEALGYPAILKTRRMGYDGKGQIRLTQEADLTKKADQLKELLTHPCILEGYVPFEREASVMVNGDLEGNYQCFPVTINRHHQGILAVSETVDPDSTIAKAVEHVGEKIAQAAHLVGLCGVECFLLGEEVYVNELAPRPHNSGHLTIEACNFSQFDAHILAITGRPLPPLRLLSPAIMVNLLGENLPSAKEWQLTEANGYFHLYKKGEAKAKRKMGHVTFLAESFDTAHSLADRFDELKTLVEEGNSSSAAEMEKL